METRTAVHPEHAILFDTAEMRIFSDRESVQARRI